MIATVAAAVVMGMAVTIFAVVTMAAVTALTEFVAK